VIQRAIVCIVESKFDGESLGILIRRVWERTPEMPLPKVTPHVIPRGRIVHEEYFKRGVELAARAAGPSGAVLVIFDADDDCPAELGPRLRGWAVEARGDFTVGIALAKYELESWLIAGAESLRGAGGLANELEGPDQPEAIRDAKGWLTRARSGGPYSPPVDQAGLMVRLDLDLARSRSDSLDKCLREIHRILGHPGAPP
jgi:hypothetical protein